VLQCASRPAELGDSGSTRRACVRQRVAPMDCDQTDPAPKRGTPRRTAALFGRRDQGCTVVGQGHERANRRRAR